MMKAEELSAACTEAFMVGDAYGAGFELKPPEYVIEHNDGLTYRQHGLDKTHRPGMTTDDTQMMLAVKKVSSAARAASRGMFADAFCATYAKNPAPGYGSRMRERLPWALTQDRPGAALIDACRMDLTNGIMPVDTCGAAMRALPCGIVGGIPLMASIGLACEQARVTHHHPDAIDAAIAVATAAHMAWSHDERSDEFLFGASLMVGWPDPQDWSRARWKRGTTRGKDIVQAAFGLLVRHDSLHKLLIDAVSIGGDVDTLAAISLGIGALAPLRWKNDLPKILRDGLIRPEGV